MRLLTYPSLYPSSQHEKCLDALAGEVREIVEELATSNRPYHTQWKLLISAIKQTAQRHWDSLALHLGMLEDPAKELSLAELLCIDAADELLTAFNETKDKGVLSEEVREMVSGWRESKDEEIRRKGVRYAKLM